MLCAPCQDISRNLEVWRQMLRLAVKKERKKLEDSPTRFNHCIFLAAIQASAREGYQICHMLCLQLEFGDDDGSQPMEELNMVYYFFWNSLGFSHNGREFPFKY